MEDSKLNRIAEHLRVAERDRKAIDPPAESGSFSPADAYRIQMINVERRVAAGRRIVGRKVGLTSIAMQKMFGVNEPDFGHLFDDMILTNGAECRASALMLPRIEPEIAFVLSRELRGPGITREDVIAATGIRDAGARNNRHAAPRLGKSRWQIRLPIMRRRRASFWARKNRSRRNAISRVSR